MQISQVMMSQYMQPNFDRLRIKISDKNCEWRFDESFIIFKFVKAKSQILVSSLYTKMTLTLAFHIVVFLITCNEIFIHNFYH